ncbi:hypothetical protein ABPG75_005901 [Micractinium tetrahymenae]
MVAWTLLVATGVTIYVQLLQSKAGWPALSKPAYSTAASLTSFALSLLLVYRTNSAYGRWAEMRTACGRMLVHLRVLLRLASTLPAGPADRAALQAVARWTPAFPALFFAFLASQPAFYDMCAGQLVPAELAALRAAKQPAPLLALATMSRLVQSTRLTPWERLALEAELSGLDACVGIAQKLGVQPLPLSYTRHTSRFLLAWLTFLPLGLAAIYGWLTIPICGVVAFLLAGVEGIGVSIEHPIRILPIKSYAAGFKAALVNQLREVGVAQELAAAALAAAAAAAQLAGDELAKQGPAEKVDGLPV